jgi:hypothetical protein
LKVKTFTINAVESGDSSGVIPEFGRWQDVKRCFGIKRGLLYRLLAEGKIKSISLREPGKKSGVRLFHLASIRDWLNGLLQEQSK